MIIRLQSQRASQGHVLVCAMVLVGIILIGVAADLSLITYQYNATIRSAAWNKTIAVAEAGIEEAYAHLNVNGLDTYSVNGVNKYAANGWAATTNGYSKRRDLGNDYYSVTIVTNATPSFISDGFVRVLPSTKYLKRTIHVTLVNQGMWRGSMLVKGRITLSGTGVTSDSFDSTNPALSTNGQYDENKRSDHGNIASNSRLPSAIDIGNGDIYGAINTGPGGTASIGNGSVGDLGWHAGSSSGVKPGHSRSDMNVAFTDITIPATITDRGSAGSGTVNGTSYSLIMGSHNYVMSSLSLSGQSKMLVNGDATLYIVDSIDMTGQSTITLATNASLTIYMAGASARFNGNGIINQTGKAVKLQYLGTPQNRSVSVSGNSAFIGSIYAPSAALSLAGGGNNELDFVGSAVAETASLNGHFKFHYDESLGNTNVVKWAIGSWNEL